jgi:hypothetical protein
LRLIYVRSIAARRYCIDLVAVAYYLCVGLFNTESTQMMIGGLLFAHFIILPPDWYRYSAF